MNDELERVWNGIVVAIPEFTSRNWWKLGKTSDTTVGVSVRGNNHVSPPYNVIARPTRSVPYHTETVGSVIHVLG
jgi:hypothetical protein